MEIDEIAADDDLERALSLFDEQLARLGLELGEKVKPGIEWVETQWRLNLLDEDHLRCRDLDTLWAWHEGGFSPWLPYDLYGLDQAVRETREQRLYDTHPFPSTWICIAVLNGARLAIDTTAGEHRASAVYQVDPGIFPRPRLDALAYLFRLWAFCYEHGVYRPDEPSEGFRGLDLDAVEVLRMTPFWSFI